MPWRKNTSGAFFTHKDVKLNITIPTIPRSHARHNWQGLIPIYLGMVQEEAFLTNSITVISGGARNRMGGPQVPVPRLT
jgi:hypothetical protein